MEMNTRIRLSTITEGVYGCDLVKQQIQVAARRAFISHRQSGHGHHSIECRINAEDPANNFMPCRTDQALLRARRTGRRIDSHAYAGYPIPRTTTR
jgi:acetyl-CoA carboxylase biotin carboxylase subunit